MGYFITISIVLFTYLSIIPRICPPDRVRNQPLCINKNVPSVRACASTKNFKRYEKGTSLTDKEQKCRFPYIYRSTDKDKTSTSFSVLEKERSALNKPQQTKLVTYSLIPFQFELLFIARIM